MVLKSQTNMQAVLLRSRHAKVLIGKFTVCGYTHAKQELMKPSPRVWGFLLFTHAGAWNLHTILIQFVWVSNEAIFISLQSTKQHFKNLRPCTCLLQVCSNRSNSKKKQKTGMPVDMPLFLQKNSPWKQASGKHTQQCVLLRVFVLHLLLD